MRRQGSPQTLERVRRAAVSLGRQGVPARQVAAAFDRHVNTVYRWLAVARDQGVDGLASQCHPGASPKLTDRQREHLIDQLLAGATVSGFSTDLWTAPRVQRLIREQFGVEYHVNYIPTLLKTFGFTPQKPECRARERDEAAIAHWLTCDWSRIKKKRDNAAQ
jgi:putative transposase